MLREDVGGQVRRDSKKNLRNKSLNQQSIFFSQLTDSSLTIRIKREMKLPILGRETRGPKSCSKTRQAKNNDLVQSWKLAWYSGGSLPSCLLEKRLSRRRSPQLLEGSQESGT